jgi:hypothetical protein
LVMRHRRSDRGDGRCRRDIEPYHGPPITLGSAARAVAKYFGVVVRYRYPPPTVRRSSSHPGALYDQEPECEGSQSVFADCSINNGKVPRQRLSTWVLPISAGAIMKVLQYCFRVLGKPACAVTRVFEEVGRELGHLGATWREWRGKETHPSDQGRDNVGSTVRRAANLLPLLSGTGMIMRGRRPACSSPNRRLRGSCC